jgi:transcriptional regulator with XRE-family HTH domain
MTNWTRNGTVPDADQILAIADYLNVSVRWLVTGHEDVGYSLDERNLVAKYRMLDAQGQHELKALLNAKLDVIEEEEPQEKRAG